MNFATSHAIRGAEASHYAKVDLAKVGLNPDPAVVQGLLGLGPVLSLTGYVIIPEYLARQLNTRHHYSYAPAWHKSQNHPEPPTAEKMVEDGQPFLLHLDWTEQKWRRDEEDYKAVKPCPIKVQDVSWFFTDPNRNYWYHQDGNVSNPVVISAVIEGQLVTIRTRFEIAEIVFGLTINEDLTVSAANPATPGKTWVAEAIRPAAIKTILAKKGYYSSYSYRQEKNNFTLSGVNEVYQNLGIRNRDSLSNLFRGMVNPKSGVLTEMDLGGVKKVHDVVYPIILELGQEDPLWLMAYRTFLANAQRTINSVKVSSVFNEAFKNPTVESVKEVLGKFIKCRNKWGEFEELIDRLDGYKDRRKKALKANTTRAFNKLMEDFEFLNLDMEKFPTLYKAVQEGDIPVSTFFRKKEQYFLLNDNFALWEEMLGRHYDIACQMAKEVSARTTYEKDLMSYFYFVLYGLPEYLLKHTGEDWTCVPKLVNSSTELDPPKEDDSGVARSRSALTPIVDNEKKVVVVPYASLAMPGRQTTYCYSHDYNVLHRGFSFGGNVVMNDLEEKMNGKDDYGLMFYTFTGSPQGRGYPTFLIIFERLSSGVTRLHFHRTHPCRSKDGDYNPVHNWIRVAYNWMAGNVNRERLKVQQGDLIFAALDHGKVEFGGGSVNSYDHHEFHFPVEFAPYTKKEKSNVLGYVRVFEDNILHHNEHDDVPVPAGDYEIRQCRSWEANPKGVWTLNID